MISNSGGPETLSGFIVELGPKAQTAVARLFDQFGFDTLDAGPLIEGWRIRGDTPAGPRPTTEELRRDLAAAKRYADR